VVFAFPLLFLGQLLAARPETPSRPTLALLGWELFAFALAGAVLMPVSGFWLFLLPAFILLSAARRRPPASGS
jgi:hypothetical protein